MKHPGPAWWKDPLVWPGLLICTVLLGTALLAPVLFPQDPSILGPQGAKLLPPSWQHPLGTDLLGREVLARLVHGSRVSLLVGWLSVLVSMVLGTAVGIVAGLSHPRLGRLLMGLTDLFMAFPRIFLVLLLVSLFRPSVGLIILVLGFSGWMPVARLVRAEALGLSGRDFAAAARGLGASEWSVARNHILPNLMPTIIVAATMRVGGIILAESFLSFLGLGVQDPPVSWGLMIQQGRDHLLDGWWLATFPGLAITLTVVGYNILGDGLRARLDPRRARLGGGDG